MKVIEAKPWIYAFECKSCGSKLEAEAEDVKIGDFGSMGEYETHPYVSCPVCEGVTKIPWNKMVPKVTALAEGKSKQRD